jgi:hypothetical protein
MRTYFDRTFNLFLAICVAFSALTILPSQSVRADEPSTSPELTSPVNHLNPDGTLNLDGSFSGSLDLQGWDVQIDSSRGPVLSVALPKGQWGSMGEGNGPLRNEVYAIAVDGTDVYLGGAFLDTNSIHAADRIVKWNGTTWSALGNNGSGEGSLNGQVNAIAVDPYDGGIYVGGSFTNVNNYGTPITAADYIAHWDGLQWNALGYGAPADGSLNNAVNAILINWDTVFVGGSFINVHNMGASLPAADYIASFNKASASWSSLGSTALNNVVRALAWGNVGMYVGGDFTNAGGTGEADYIAKFNFGTSTWEALRGNGSGNGSLNGQVYSLAADYVGHDIVYVGGNFSAVYDGDVLPMPNVSYLTVWDESSWGAVSAGLWPVNAAVRSITLLGSDVYIGGDFTNAGGNAEADNIAKVSAGVWSALGNNGAGNGALKNSIYALANNGTRLYVGGAFDAVQNGNISLLQNNYFAQWENGAWIANTPSNGSISRKVNCIAVNGTDVYVGGEFTNLSNNGVVNLAADYIAKWDGTNWSNLGGSFLGLNGSLNGAVNSIGIWGSNVFVGGNFVDVNNYGTILPAADYIAKWDGTNWSALGSTAALNAPVNVLLVDSNVIYVGGNFLNADGITAADYIVRVNTINNAWNALGSNGLPGNGSLNAPVYALALHSVYLYVGGAFTDVNDNGAVISQADYIAKFSGNWQAVGNGAAPALSGAVYSLLLNKINGVDLYVGGNFTNVVNNNVPIPQADYIAKWNGSNWSALGNNGAGDGAITGDVLAIAMFGTYVYAGGLFTNVGSTAGDYIMEWNGSSWLPLSTNGIDNGSLYGVLPDTGVHALAVSNNLYVGGEFYNVNDNGNILSKADYIAAYGVDNTPPLVVSSIRADPTFTTAASVDYTVTFSEHITGIDTADFQLTTIGVSGAAVSGVSNNAGSVYTVTVNTGSGNGTIRLDITDNNSIIDEAFNPLGGASVGDGNFITGEVYTVNKPSTFADVPFGYWANGYIERLYKAGITGGCTSVPLNYCPTTPVTRAQMAIFLLRGIHGKLYTPPPATGTKFTDVPLGTFGAAWIEQLATEGITSGCGGGNYCPTQTVSRAQMAIFLVRAKHGVAFVPPTATGLFPDVPVGSFGANYIEQLVADAITSGCGGGNYCPNTMVKRDSMAVFLVKTFNLP